MYGYNARFYDSELGRFAQADSIVPDPYNPLDWDRYSYVRNNPINNSDPTGHRPCDERHNCEATRYQTTPVKQPKWSTKSYSNQDLGNSLAALSTKLQHSANFFSYLGAISEVGFTTAGLSGGTAAVGWVDLGFPIADVSGGLAGGIVGWEIGHGIHTAITNPIESGLSSAAALTTYASDFILENTRVDLYDNNLTLVVGQSTTTAVALTAIGNSNTIGIVDAAVDQVGSWYADGKIGGAYDLFGITGKSISSPFGFFTFQFGDR